MNSSFTVTDLGGYSPLDYAQTSYLKMPLAGVARATQGAEQWKFFVEPNVGFF